MASRVDMIKQHDKCVSCRSLVQMLNVGKTKVQSIISDPDFFWVMWQSGVNCENKMLKVCKTMNYKLKNLIYEFFCQVRSNNIPFTGKLLQGAGHHLQRRVSFR